MSGDDGAVFNPFQPPRADIDAPGEPTASAEGRLASRGARLGAAVLDGVLYMLAFAPAMASAVTSGAAQAPATEGKLGTFWWLGVGPLQVVSVLACLGLVVVQAYLVATTGQSVGKRASRIRIVKHDGRPVGFVDGVLVRSWLFGAVGWVPGIGGVIGLADVLFIFRGDRRCLHDLLAGTKVIDVGS